MALYFFTGDTSFVSETISNPYSGDVFTINDTYLVNNTIYNGSAGEEDILLMTTNPEVLFLVDDMGSVVLNSIETVLGSGGSDILNFASATVVLGDMQVSGGDGDDLIWANAGNDEIHGNNGNDILDGGPGNDTLLGDDGDDLLTGGEGDDTLDGGAGDDTMAGGDGADTYVAGIGNDTIVEASSADINMIDLPDGIVESDLTFNINGNDLEIAVGATGTILVSGQFDAADSGIDTLNFSDGTSFDLRTVQPPPPPSNDPTEGDDILEGTEDCDRIHALGGDDVVHGLGGNDKLYGDAGNDSLFGDDGNDKLYGGRGNDMLDGGMGNDRLDGGCGDDVLDGSAGNDNLYGGYGDDILIGGEGNDKLYGGDGDDILVAGAGKDRIDGGKGNDTIVYDVMDGAVDTIYNFDAGRVSHGHGCGGGHGFGHHGHRFGHDAHGDGHGYHGNRHSDNHDVLNITDILEGYDALSDSISDFVRLVNRGHDTVLQVNADGDAGGAFTSVAVFKGGLDHMNVQDMLDNGSLVVDQSAMV